MSQPQSDWPAPGLHPLGRHAPADLARAAAQHRNRWVEVPLAALVDRAGALRAIGTALAFPPHHGANLDALRDCLADLPEHDASPGWALLLQGLSRTAAFDGRDRATLLEVFRLGVAELGRAGRELRVFHD